jgi:putative redox protein
MRASASWTKDQQFDLLTESGHHVTSDTSSTHEAGPTPMELVLSALCGCTAVDVVSILQKKREPFAGLTVSAIAEQAAEPPRVFTRIVLKYQVRGNVSKNGMERAVSLSKDKYCSISKMLEKSAEIVFEIEYADSF